MVMPYHLHMPSYFLETFTEYPYLLSVDNQLFTMIDLFINSSSFCHRSVSVSAILYSILKIKSLMIPF